MPGPDPYPRAPFGVVDELSCYYDGPAEPNNVHLEAWLPGHLDPRELRAAVAATLRAQPRARARRVPGHPWRRGYTWECPPRPDTDPVLCTTWADDEGLARERASFLATALPLGTSPPLRLLLARGPGQDCVILKVHHAAFDGISCLQLLRRIAHNYEGTQESAQVSKEPAQAAQMAVWPTAGTSDPVPGPPAVFPKPRAAEGGRVLPRPAARVAAQRPDGASWRHKPGYGFHLMTWPWTRTPAWLSQCGGTVNDMLIAAMIMTIGRWNAAHGRRAGRIRITMPLGGHRGGLNDGTAGNLSRLATVTASPPGQGATHRELVADVARQTRRAKEIPGPQVGSLCRALVAAWCPAGLKRRALRVALRTLGPLVCDTSLISNLGVLADPPRFGPATATRMWFSTSAHMPRGLSLGAITTDDGLHLCFRYRRALFDEAAAAQFAAGYAAVLSLLTGAGPEG